MGENYELKKCPNCGHKLDRIVYVSLGFEEWVFNDNSWECIGRNSLIDDPQKEVLCPECEQKVGTGIDFGFI